MYTEYVYDIKRYEVASREIKATLFDIVATEESKIAELREKAFVDATDAQLAADLQQLYVQQDACLREILAISDKLTKALQRVDSCSRKLKQIENKNTAQIIATIQENAYTQQVPQQPVAQEQPQIIQEQPQIVAQEEIVPDKKNEVVEEPVLIADEGDAVAAQNEEKGVTGATSVAMAPAAKPVEGATYENPNEEFAMSFDDDAYAAKQAQATEGGEEVVADAPSTTVTSETNPSSTTTTSGTDKPVEGATFDNPNEEFAMSFDDDAYAAKKAQAAEGGEEVVADAPSGDTTTATTDVPQIIVENTDAPQIVVENTDAPQVISEEPAVKEEVKEEAPVIAPAEAPSTEEVPTTSAPLIPIENTEVKLTINDASTDTTAQGAPLLETVSNGNQLIPIADAPVVSEGSSSTEDKLVFKKRSPAESKVIMISGKQAAKLKQSLPTQEALLSAKGFFKPSVTDANLEQQLVSNGLLEAAPVDKQAQIEQMMNQANELYAQGKVEEAQTMYNQISELNKELQGESAGLTK